VKVEVLPGATAGVDLAAGLARLRSLGIRCLLVEGGSRVITSVLRERLADRVVVAVAPILLGTGTDAVGDLGAGLVRDGLRLQSQTVHRLGPDLVVAADLDWDRG
jgi:riboflavin biosynthesis pyrimidine reductase